MSAKKSALPVGAAGRCQENFELGSSNNTVAQRGVRIIPWYSGTHAETFRASEFIIHGLQHSSVARSLATGDNHDFYIHGVLRSTRRPLV